MKKQNGAFSSNVGTPQEFTVSLVPGTIFLTKPRNARTTFLSSFTYEPFFAGLRGLALMQTPLRCGLAKMSSRALVAEVYSSNFSGCVK